MSYFKKLLISAFSITSLFAANCAAAQEVSQVQTVGTTTVLVNPDCSAEAPFAEVRLINIHVHTSIEKKSGTGGDLRLVVESACSIFETIISGAGAALEAGSVTTKGVAVPFTGSPDAVTLTLVEKGDSPRWQGDFVYIGNVDGGVLLDTCFRFNRWLGSGDGFELSHRSEAQIPYTSCRS